MTDEDAEHDGLPEVEEGADGLGSDHVAVSSLDDRRFDGHVVVEGLQARDDRDAVQGVGRRAAEVGRGEAEPPCEVA